MTANINVIPPSKRPSPPDVPVRPKVTAASPVSDQAQGLATIKVVPTTPAPVKSPSPAPEAPKAADVRPAARRARIEMRHKLLASSFIACVLVIPFIAALYLWLFAANQYHSQMGFSIRTENGASSASMLSGLAMLAGSNSSSDSDILFEFVQSQNLVADMDAELDLRALWSKPSFDPYFTVSPDASLEQLVKYWNKMVHISRAKSPGLINVEVRAFSPEDATLIAQKLFEKSSAMINKLSNIAHEDTIRYSRADLDEAEARVQAARQALTMFRTQNQIVDPALDLQSQAGLMGSLNTQHAEALIELDLLRKTVSPNDPRLVQTETRINVIEARIAAERNTTGKANSNDRPYAEVVGDFERLTVEREFAEQSYASALANYDLAVAEARRQSRYLAPYMEPTAAESSLYPKRFVQFFSLVAFMLLAWAIGVLIFYSIRDRR